MIDESANGRSEKTVIDDDTLHVPLLQESKAHESSSSSVDSYARQKLLRKKSDIRIRPKTPMSPRSMGEHDLAEMQRTKNECKPLALKILCSQRHLMLSCEFNIHLSSMFRRHILKSRTIGNTKRIETCPSSKLSP